jgi:hypothetical protein
MMETFFRIWTDFSVATITMSVICRTSGARNSTLAGRSLAGVGNSWQYWQQVTCQRSWSCQMTLKLVQYKKTP